MPRARMVHPEFFTDSKVGRVSRGARLLFIALWCHGDDAGLHPLDLSQLRAEAFPHEKDTSDLDVGDLLLELIRKDYRVVPYTGDDGLTYLCVRNFLKRQTIRYPSKHACPLPPFISETGGVEGKRKTYLYELNRVALLRYLKDQAGDVVEIMSGSCSAQVPLMCGRTKRNELRESREKGLDLDLPSSTVQGASSPLKSKSSPVASDLDSKPETGADQSCLDNPDSMFTRAVSGLEAAIGSTLSPGVRHKLLAALQGFCGRLCLCHSLPHADRITRVLPVCRKVADEAVSILRGSEDWPSPDSLVVRYVEAIHTARKVLMDEIIEAALPAEAAHAKEG